MRIEFNDTRLSTKLQAREGESIFAELSDGVTYTFSGKSAISLLLRYYRSTGRLGSRAEQLMVPHWLGAWVYMCMHEYCFPTTAFNPLTRGIFVYHQWGFPQQMKTIASFCRENDLFCIEDCAHAFQSDYQGKRVGTFGDASVFSLAKFFPCVTGGAIYSRDAQLKDFLDRAFTAQDEQLSKSAFRKRAVFDTDPSSFEHRNELAGSYAVYDKIYDIRPYALAAVRSSMARNPMLKRLTNYQSLAREFSNFDFVETLPSDGIMPWIFPLFVEEPHRTRIAQSLLASGIEAGVYHFDVNRNMLNPDFRKCVAIPCHQGLSESELSSIMEITKSNL